MISVIYSVEKENDEIIVEAVIEDAIQIRSQTLVDPPEYGPAVCKATFYLSEDDKLPDNDDEMIEYLEMLDLDWTPTPRDDCEY